MKPEEYAIYRSQLEAGRILFDTYKATKVVRPEAKTLLDSLSGVILSDVVGVLAAQPGGLVDEDAPDPTPEEDALAATLAFGEYDTLRAALDKAAGPTVAEINALAPEAATGGLEWWAVALAAGGVLWKLGSTVIGGPWGTVAKVVALMFFGVAAYTGLTAKTEAGKLILAETASAVGQGAADIGSSLKSILLWSLGGLAAVAVIGAGIYVYHQAQLEGRTPRRRRAVEA